MPSSIKECYVSPLGYAQITPTVATGLTPPAQTNYAVIVCETFQCRWRDDGTDPTASVGMLLPAGTYMTYTGNLKALKFIDTSAGACKVNISYYEQK